MIQWDAALGNKMRGKGTASTWEDSAPPWCIKHLGELAWYCCKAKTRLCVHPLNPDPPPPFMNADLENESKEKERISARPVLGELV